jgi:hypothetical protein
VGLASHRQQEHSLLGIHFGLQDVGQQVEVAYQPVDQWPIQQALWIP